MLCTWQEKVRNESNNSKDEAKKKREVCTRKEFLHRAENRTRKGCKTHAVRQAQAKAGTTQALNSNSEELQLKQKILDLDRIRPKLRAKFLALALLALLALALAVSLSCMHVVHLSLSLVIWNINTFSHLFVSFPLVPVPAWVVIHRKMTMCAEIASEFAKTKTVLLVLEMTRESECNSRRGPNQ